MRTKRLVRKVEQTAESGCLTLGELREFVGETYDFPDSTSVQIRVDGSFVWHIFIESMEDVP